MTWGLATLAIAAAITGDWEGDLGARVLVSGGQSPLDATTEQVGQVAIELSPTARLRYVEGNKGLELSYSPRITQRFILESERGPAPDITGPISFHTGDLSLRWRLSRRTSIEMGATAGFGLLSFNDTLTNSTSGDGQGGDGQGGDGGQGGGDQSAQDAQNNAEILTVGGRMSLATVVVPRGDVFRISADVSNFTTLTDGATALDRTRIASSIGYLFAPTSVDGFELAVNGEGSLYPDTSGLGNGQAGPQEAAFGGATLGWVRKMSRRTRGSLRAGVLMLFNEEIQVVPSALIDCTIDTYQGPGLRVVTTFSAGFVGGTSSVDVAAEPRVVSGLDVRFTIVPDQAFGINVSFNAPLSISSSDPNAEPTVPSISALILGLPFAWQISPGFDLELGARLGLRGVIRTSDGIPTTANGVQLADFGDTYDAQIYMGIAWAIASTGESRFQR